MAIITPKACKLSILEKIAKGQVILSLSTGNPNVPGNEDAVAAFAAAQEEMIRTNNAESVLRKAIAAAKTARENAVANWMNKLNGLAGITVGITDGDAEKILSAGFPVRSARTPAPALPAPEELRARTNGKPGRTRLQWRSIRGAKSYIIQANAEPSAADAGWQTICICTTATMEVEGAEPGQPQWYRVAAVNGRGQSPWSAPAARPVM